MLESCRRIRLLAGRNLKEILRDPLSLAFMLALPLFMEVLFYFLFHKLTPQFEMKYLAPGIVVFSQSFLTLFAGLLIALDRSTAFLTRLFVSKTRSFEFILGYALALIPVAFLQALLFFLAGGILDPTIFGPGMLWGALLSVVTSFLFIGLGILCGSLCNEKSVGGVSSIVIMCQSVLSGMWFPVEGMSETFLTVLKCLPFKSATELIQKTVNGFTDPAEFWKPLLIVLGYSLLAFIAAICCFHGKMKAK